MASANQHAAHPSGPVRLAKGAAPTDRRTGLVWLRNWPVRSKLVAVLVVPALAFLVVASFNVQASISSAQDYGRGATLAEFGRDVTRVTHELQRERDLAAGFIAGGRSKDLGDTLMSQRRSVDAAVADFRDAAGGVAGLGGQPKAKLDRATAGLDKLGRLRDAVASASLPQGAVFAQYSDITSALLDLDNEIGQRSGNRELTQSVTVLNDLSRAKEITTQVRGELYAISIQGGFGFGQFQELSGVLARQESARERFRSDANDRQRALYDEVVNGQAVLAVKRIEDSAVNRQQSRELRIDPQQWFAASTTQIELMRTVESRLLDAVISQSQRLRSSAQRQAILTGLGIGAILLVALVTSLLIARSMIEPLRRLRASALDVAHNRLPRVIELLRSSDGQETEITVDPIDVSSRDEIGEVAQTFDELHREAVRLAAEQAALRSNVNTIFVNLSRRSQSLIERQLELIDQLESGEQDPDQLSNLFRLDHLATRMRRNSENLLILAGENAGRRWSRPIPLVDVIRAAVAEVEQYQRVRLGSVPDVEVVGQVVNHLVHLLAELIENATHFSSSASEVSVASQRLPDGGAMVEIEDQGIGMAPQELAETNERLASPPVFDVSVSRMMGLFVVGRLATRHDITVRLRQSQRGGVSALVRLPADVVVSYYEPRPHDVRRPETVTPEVEAVETGRPEPRLARGVAVASLPTAPDRREPASLNGGVLNGSQSPLRHEPPQEERPRRVELEEPVGRVPRPAAEAPARTRVGTGPGTRAEEYADVHAPAYPQAYPQPQTRAEAPPPAPAEAETADDLADDVTPIFDSVSLWFSRRRPGPPASAVPVAEAAPGAVPPTPSVAPAPVPAAVPPPSLPAEPAPSVAWTSAGDEGWRAAEALRQPSVGGLTRAGLPIRVPMTHLVPGAAGPSGERREPVPSDHLAPEKVRGRLSSYYQGVTRGREEGGQTSAGAPFGEEER